ncbi:MAG: hypothetical protein A2431_01550 [Candidatus Zambryskibacteria bacterium RIFOXYC1_FULL_39_10]|uniref:Pilus assembly protein PilO n=1 Tax=Candidatus Zambryskibacteria bacterium RIFOXYC1_FULL_39_10 TaxID=1802779 RepID=A0A1G2V414_9BACT|nr:MAG: hypothetical protein A2605_03180 [Candidatus Zambryskibacteria bacterium RIFOXYD1_FULL_39_35]OHB16364.1 MAG: hypothetical protein A2431_01550 [Candidatus Zambryskibacteria bacterium RIFOXYC1_FULL_39_10]
MSNTTLLIYFLLTIAVGYAFAYPSVGEISALMTEKEKQESTLVMMTEIEAKKNELLTKYNKISSEDKKYIETVLPDSLDFVKLISQIDAVGSKYGLSVDKTSFRQTDSAQGETVSEAGPQKPYQSAIISFSFNGSYSQFNSFMNDLGQSLRILDIKSLKLTGADNGVYSYNVEFEVYWLK